MVLCQLAIELAKVDWGCVYLQLLVSKVADGSTTGELTFSLVTICLSWPTLLIAPLDAHAFIVR